MTCSRRYNNTLFEIPGAQEKMPSQPKDHVFVDIHRSNGRIMNWADRISTDSISPYLVRPVERTHRSSLQRALKGNMLSVLQKLRILWLIKSKRISGWNDPSRLKHPRGHVEIPANLISGGIGWRSKYHSQIQNTGVDLGSITSQYWVALLQLGKVFVSENRWYRNVELPFNLVTGGVYTRSKFSNAVPPFFVVSVYSTQRNTAV